MEGKQETMGIQIRFPGEMYETLKLRAAKEHRSLNGEVLFSLETYFAAVTAIEKAREGAITEGFGGKAGE
jgi:plasmid stability protein